MQIELNNWLVALVALPMLTLATFATVETDIHMSLTAVLACSAAYGLFRYVRSHEILTAELLVSRDEISDLRRRLACAESANQSKSQLIANVSHEIRTPLSAILGFVELMDDCSLPVEDRLAFSKIIRNNSEYLIKVVNDILDFSRIENGRLEITNAPTDLAQVITSVAEMMKVKADEKNLALNVEFRSDFPRLVLVDEGRVRQILVNLIGNAIKFTARGVVTVQAACTPSLRADYVDFELIVRDTGEGIDPAMHDMLFTMFTQCSSHSADRPPGSGIGLALSRRLARLMNGDVDMLSSVPDEGSSFVFRLPAKVAESKPRRIAALSPGL